MKYLKTIDLWNDGMIDALRNGQLQLQRGQWVRCGQLRPSRFVRVTERGTIYAVHPEGNDGVSRFRFNRACKTW